MFPKYLNVWCLLPMALLGCITPTRPETGFRKINPSIDVQGHRGCRGLLPENTIPAFIKALEIGVTTLEMDVVITQDQQVLVSHDPFLSHKLCFGPKGEEITEENEKSYNLFEMTYEEIRQCDCGSKEQLGFPEQRKLVVSKPLLTQVIDSVEYYLRTHALPPVYYNIETKTLPEGDNIFHPAPAPFVDLLVKVLKEKNILDRTIIQSFDIRTLQYAKEAYPDIRLALLVANKDLPEENIEKLGFVPNIYSPYYLLVNEKLVNYAHQQKMLVIPWTVNKPIEIKRIMSLGVDGIITDYPDRAMAVIQ
jgi:glycerophosphoryl diester phosphodiesterase